VIDDWAGTQPWLLAPLNEWSIVGMNHYHIDEAKMIFVAMAKDGRVIKAEGMDNQNIWAALQGQAIYINLEDHRK